MKQNIKNKKKTRVVNRSSLIRFMTEFLKLQNEKKVPHEEQININK